MYTGNPTKLFFVISNFAEVLGKFAVFVYTMKFEQTVAKVLIGEVCQIYMRGRKQE